MTKINDISGIKSYLTFNVKMSDSFLITLVTIASVSLAITIYLFPVIYLLGIILFICSAILFFLRPEWFLYFFAVSRISLDAVKLLSYQSSEIGIRWNLSLDGIINGLLLLCALIYFIKKKNIKIFSLPGIKAYLLFLVICIISLSYSLDKIVGIRYLIHYFTYFLIYVLGINILNTKEKNHKMIFAVCLSTLIPFIVGFYQAITGQGNLLTPGFNRIYATTYHPNAYAFYLVMMLIFLFTIYLYATSGKKRVVLFLFAMPISLSLILTYTRGAWLAVIFGLTVLFLLSGGKNKYKIFILVFILTMVISLTGAYFGPRIIDRLLSLTSPTADTFGWRVQVWSMNFKEFLKHPIIGYGIGSSNIIGQERGGYLFAPHNDYLRLMVETGLLGWGAFLVVIISLFRFFFRKYRSSIGAKEGILAGGLVALLLSTLVIQTGDNLHHYDNVFIYFWFFIVIGHNLLREV